jgi:RHS repeat-associated protein
LDESFTYDANGNRTNTGYSTGGNNQLLSDGTYNYQYDAEGNRTQRTNIATGEVTEYEWDHRNRLVKITDRDASGTATKVVEYAYDFQNRRLAKHIDNNADGTFDKQSFYVYDGERQERGNAGDHIAVLFDGSGALTNRYLHGPAIDQILADEQLDEILGTTAPGNVLWPLTDNLGTVRDLVEYDDAMGITSVINHLTYDAFGGVASESNAAVHIFAFTGREFDEESGFSYHRARYYDASSGRWVSEDPIGFEAGDVSLYRYVGNQPTTKTDPSGLQEVKGPNDSEGTPFEGFPPLPIDGLPVDVIKPNSPFDNMNVSIDELLTRIVTFQDKSNSKVCWYGSDTRMAKELWSTDLIPIIRMLREEWLKKGRQGILELVKVGKITTQGSNRFLTFRLESTSSGTVQAITLAWATRMWGIWEAFR